jgi:hypothetical protein
MITKYKTTTVFLFRMIPYHLWLKLHAFTNKKGKKNKICLRTQNVYPEHNQAAVYYIMFNFGEFLSKLVISNGELLLKKAAIYVVKKSV